MFLDQTALAIAAIFIFAGIVKGTVGIGMPTVSVGLMSQFVPPHMAIAIVVFPLLFSNIWQIIRSKVSLKTVLDYWLLIALLVVSLWVTTFFTVQMPAEFLLGVIGTAIVIFATSSLAKSPPKLPNGSNPVAQAVTGISAGILGGLTSIWSPPIVTFLIAKRVENDEFVRAAGLFVFVGAIPLTIGYWQTGLLNGNTAPLSAMMILPTLIGFSLGEIIRRRLQPERFRTVLLWIFLLMGINLLRRAIF
ncbi:sulfite exporter TauE/SafE family protein [Sulfitobacter sp.]|uniref:sulfite exporter TauE/SafE family protein n=1 Tax=Sulfitobacter sp. TaxID=1903071 RepID=UPI003001AA66